MLAVPALRKDGSRIVLKLTILPFCGEAARRRDVTARYGEIKQLGKEIAAFSNIQGALGRGETWSTTGDF
jgi:hypothetical protein